MNLSSKNKSWAHSDKSLILCFQRNKWKKYVRKRENKHNYGDPSTFKQLEDTVRAILVKHPQGINQRKFIRTLDHSGHYFKDDVNLIESLVQQMDHTALWEHRKPKDDAIYPVDWEKLKEREMRQWRAQHAQELMEKGRWDESESRHLISEAPVITRIEKEMRKERQGVKEKQAKIMRPGRYLGKTKRGEEKRDSFYT
eukprot:CAMPEP_0196586094 /NCGR_PEP_ID=MMETSP1081-20130531/53095_1 /TAXON_ID=36882 /ORGANISM="Pyramimonas amylifera, Strain CCMP720" /LENGTH=197 /DNA_ID=CAMNT_0041907853 /DNA_START=293 /DNA_END=886 /DNA_ORIENTATION=+